MRSRVLECLLVASLIGGAAMAQAPPPASHDPLGGNLFPPELVMRHQQAIGLSDEQKGLLREEVKNAQSRFTDLQWELQDAMEQFASLLADERVDERQALAQLDKVLEAERRIKREQITLMVRIKNHLEPEQQARLRQLGQPAPGHGR